MGRLNRDFVERHRQRFFEFGRSGRFEDETATAAGWSPEASSEPSLARLRQRRCLENPYGAVTVLTRLAAGGCTCYSGSGDPCSTVLAGRFSLAICLRLVSTYLIIVRVERRTVCLQPCRKQNPAREDLPLSGGASRAGLSFLLAFDIRCLSISLFNHPDTSSACFSSNYEPGAPIISGMDFTHATPTDVRTPSNGFTFLECLLTLVIIGIATSLATVNLLEYTKRRTLLLETDRVRLLLEHAAILSLTTGDAVGVTLSDSGISVTPLNAARSIRYEFAEDIRIKRVGSSSQAPLAFYPTTTASPTTLSIVSSAGTCSITISLRTRITALC